MDTSKTHLNEAVQLANRQMMAVRLVAPADAARIAAAHPLPHEKNVSDELYRNYYELKTLLYARAPGAGVISGWVDGELAGFVFFCTDIAGVSRFTKSAGNLCWLLGQILRGRLGYRLTFLVEIVKWGLQHLRQPRDYREPAPADALPEVASWIGTVETVEGFRRLGVAAALLDRAEQLLQAAGARQVALWVASDNEPALQLYEKLHYRQVSLVPRLGEACWLMLKTF
jgi:ribosomal protein S18 acetylase RimI-like enzyme